MNERGLEPGKAERKKARKVSRSSLMKAAVYYLERFSASRSRLALVLTRKAYRSLQEHGGDIQDCKVWIEEILNSLESQGILNDAAYAEARARSLVARGTAVRSVRLKLRQSGIDETLTTKALNRLTKDVGKNLDDSSLDLTAAVAYARRRRLGPWRLVEREIKRNRDLAALARQGFSADIALYVIDARDRDILEREAGFV